jgi:DNA polymerase
MADLDPFNADELHRQVRQHLSGLKAAGVEWLPTATSAAATPQAAPIDLVAPAPEPIAVQVSLPLVGDGPDLTVAERREALKALIQTVAGCRRCPQLASTRRQTVFGVGPLDPDLCFIGEAPGADEDAQGEPFVGAAGQLLDRIIVACGMKREDVFICNILRCRPPGNRQPTADEAANCREFLDRTLELVRPKFICCLGGTAATNLLGTTQSMTKLRGRFFDYKGTPVVCTYHPAYLLPHRSPDKKKDVWEDMKKLLAKMGKPVPQPKKSG